MAIGISFVSIIYGLCAGFLGFLIGQDVENARQERARRKTWYDRYLRMKEER